MAIRTGTSGPDALEGTHEGDLIQGLGGNDLIDAASSTASPPNDGPDTVDGGAGNDTLTVSSVEPLPGGTLLEVNGTNVDVSSTSTAMDVDAVSIEFIRFHGSFGDDTVISEDAANVLVGGSGIDTWTSNYSNHGSNIRFVINTPSLLRVPNLNQVHGFERINFTAGGGNDIITSLHQNDFLEGGPGNDRLSPGSVRDAPAGTIDIVSGGLGNDTLVIDARSDRDGVSLAVAGAPNFIVSSVSGDFAVNGFSMDRVEFTGGQGNDTINTGTGAVIVDGQRGIDHWIGDLSGATSAIRFDHSNPNTHRLDQVGIKLIAAVERYNLTGSRFNDTITTHNQGDVVDGGEGNDIVDLKTRPSAPGAPTDSFFGGLGEDTLVVDASGESLPVQLFSAGSPRFLVRSTTGNFFVDAFGVEKVFFTGGSGADFIDTADAGGRIHGSSGIDHWVSNFGGFTRSIVFRLGDSDLNAVEMESIFSIERITMTTGSGNDRITGGSQLDAMATADGNDVIDAGTRPVGSSGVDIVDGGAGNDVLVVDSRFVPDAIQITLAGNPRFFVRSTFDRFAVDASTERLEFRGGDRGDSVSGHDSNDTLRGNGGRDTLAGGGARDTLAGGADRDTFDFNNSSESRPVAADLVLDFASGVDRFDLRDMEIDFHFIGTQGFHDVAGELRSVAGRLEGDVNGDGVADFRVILDNGATAVRADLLL